METWTKICGPIPGGLVLTHAHMAVERPAKEISGTPPNPHCDGPSSNPEGKESESPGHGLTDSRFTGLWVSFLKMLRLKVGYQKNPTSGVYRLPAFACETDTHLW